AELVAGGGRARALGAERGAALAARRVGHWLQTEDPKLRWVESICKQENQSRCSIRRRRCSIRSQQDRIIIAFDNKRPPCRIAQEAGRTIHVNQCRITEKNTMHFKRKQILSSKWNAGDAYAARSPKKSASTSTPTPTPATSSHPKNVCMSSGKPACGEAAPPAAACADGGGGDGDGEG
ncbi:unnamed protein product, partial [Urochloa humidicola]